MNNSLSTPENQWAFGERELEKCWKCGETNPVKAVMCWACYAALDGSKIGHRQGRFEAGREQFFDCLPFVGAAILIASGYNRKHRGLLIGLGLVALGVNWVQKSGFKDFKIEWAGRVQPNEEATAIQRIADTILLYAAREGASKIRLRAGVGIHVHYLLGDQWQEQMKIPGYVWNDLCAHFMERSDSWKRPIIFQMNEKRFEFAPHFESDFPLETLTLSLLP